MANEMYIEGSLFDANLTNSGWCDYLNKDGENYVIATAYSANSVTAINATDPTAMTIEKQLVDAVNLGGVEFIEIINDDNAIVGCLTSHSVLTLNISDISNMAIAGTPLVNGPAQDGYLTGMVGGAIVNNLGGYDRVMFCCAYNNKRITSVNYSDLLNPVILDSKQSDTYLTNVVTCIYHKGYLYCAVRTDDCLTVFDVSDPTTMTYVTHLTDPVSNRFQRLGGLNLIYDDILVAMCGDSNNINFVDISDPTAPFITNALTNDPIIDRPLVAAFVRNDISLRYMATSVYDEDGIVLVNMTDPTNASIAQSNLINNATLNGADDTKWDPTTKRLYVTCGVSKRIAVVKIPLLETFMATIIKTWTAAVELHSSPAFGGTDAVLAADQAYDYTADVDLETNGYSGAQVLVEAKLNFAANRSLGAPAVPGNMIIDVFASLDGSTYDTVPYQSYTIKGSGVTLTNPDGDFQRLSFLVEELAHFRIGVRTVGTEDTYDYRITHQTWLLTNA
jgi:hypothetical protein